MNNDILKKFTELREYIMAYELEITPNVGSDSSLITIKASITFGEFTTHSFGQGKTVEIAQSEALLNCFKAYKSLYPG